MEESRSPFKILTGKPVGRRFLGSPGRKWQDSITMDHKEICVNMRDWVDSARIEII